MTTTPPEAPTGPPTEEGPRVTRDEIRDLGRLRRSSSDRKVAGVAGGLARHLDIDPLVLRVAFVVLAFFGGAGLIVYGACWLLVPDEESGEAPVTLDERSRTVALLVVGVLAAFALIGDSWGVFWFPWPLAIIAVVVLVFLTRKDRDRGAPARSMTTTTYAAPPAYAAPATRPVAPRDPQRRGPVLFWFTLALIALGVGVLGLLDVAGVPVADPAYPALALGITGVMLLVGSVYGRAGGLILLGLLTTVGLAGATAASHWDGDVVTVSPTTVSELEAAYDFSSGELVLDLTGLDDVEELDGRTLDLEGGVGRIEVIVPDGVEVTVDAEVGGPGSIRLFGQVRDGIANKLDGTYGSGDVELTIDARLGVGEIHMDQE